MLALGRTIVPGLLTACAALAAVPAVTLDIQLETSGAVSVTSVSRQGNLQFAPFIAAVIGCRGRMTAGEDIFGHFRCPDALRRDGLVLEGVFDFSPIAQHLAAGDEIQLSVSYPRLGFAESSAPLPTETHGRRLLQSGPIPANSPAVRIRFGYRPQESAWIFAPLLAMALAIASTAAFVCKRGLPHLHRSVFILGATLWLSIVWRLQATEPLSILFAGTPFAIPASAALQFLPPLICVAAGVALGSRPRPGSTRGSLFQETFWGYGMFVFPMACGLAAIPFLAEEGAWIDGAWIDAAPWLIVAAASGVWSYRRIRAMTGSTTRQITAGPLSDRVSELAAKAGHKNARLYVSSSTRTQTSNAFALAGRGIVLTAPLVSSLNKREVDAIAAHELSHFGHRKPGMWLAFIIGAVLFNTVFSDLLVPLAGRWAFPEAVLPLVFLFSLRGARKREFAADAGSVSLTGDPRAMISGLARVARNNSQPLEFGRLVEWFSTHPSTRKRIRAIAVAARIDATEAQALCDRDEPGETYVLPVVDTSAIFNERWQAANSARYGWAIVLAAPAAGLAVALGIGQMAAVGPAHYIGGIIAGCLLTKWTTEAVMACGYARLRRRLARKLEVGGALVGFSPGDQPRLFGGYRYRDAGLLWFEGGRLCYRSERTAIDLAASDIVEIKMAPAAPAAWFSLMPVIRFRSPQSGEVHAFILHPLDFGVVGRSLFGKIERWRAVAEPAAGNAPMRGFEEAAGEPIRPSSFLTIVRGFRISGGITLVGAMAAGWPLEPNVSGWYALAVAASAYASLLLPMVFCRPGSEPPLAHF